MKAMYLFINKHMKALAVILVACLVPVAAVPAPGLGGGGRPGCPLRPAVCGGLPDRLD